MTNYIWRKSTKNGITTYKCKDIPQYSILEWHGDLYSGHMCYWTIRIRDEGGFEKLFAMALLKDAKRYIVEVLLNG